MMSVIENIIMDDKQSVNGAELLETPVIKYYIKNNLENDILDFTKGQISSASQKNLLKLLRL